MEEIQGWDVWAEQYKPVKNHLYKYADPDSTMKMFETYGEEVEYIQNYDPKYVWTYVDSDMCSLILAGYHYVNRLGYYITEVPWTDEDTTVLLSVERECECYDEEAWDNGEREDAGDPNCTKCEGYGLVTEYVG